MNRSHIPPEEKYRLEEEILILLVGIRDRPVPTEFHLQKELFILTTVIPKLKDIIVFDTHHQGVYRLEIQYSVDSQLYYKGAIEKRNGKIYLTEYGRDKFMEIKYRYQNDHKFLRLLKIMELIRDIYDKLSVEEFALLLYTKYPDTSKASTILDSIKAKKKEIIEGLRKKGYISEERYQELLVIDD